MPRQPQPNILKQATIDPRPGPVEEALQAEQRQRLSDALDTLTDQQIQVVTLRFGLAHHRPRSITFIAKVMRISQAEAVATLAEALAQLRERME